MGLDDAETETRYSAGVEFKRGEVYRKFPECSAPATAAASGVFQEGQGSWQSQAGGYRAASRR